MTQQFETIFLDPDGFDVEDIVSALAVLRRKSQTNRYGNGRLPELPSRAAILDTVEDLTAVLYPRHFGPYELTPETTDAFLTRTLGRALRMLREQVRRELKLFEPEAADDALASRARLITEEFAQALPQVRMLLDTDIRAAFTGDPAAKSLDEVVFCYPGVSAIIRHRLAHRLYLLGATMIARIVAEIAHSQTGIDIHPGATIGESFFIDHGTGVVIGETAVIGKRVRLYQAVTLGAKRFDVDENGALEKGKPRHPIIEDDVVIYAGATVLGRITIGRGSAIGGNVWLTQSVPPGANISQAKARVEVFDHGAGI
ncbi:serine O-acetyltransferase EpsC [Methylocystis sp. JR02]|uniref:serine O-acetyltransferase EpsC n=1 Tax=Methylocystis sp. JR02 TaxID=3046284 RepID=UPI0024B9A7C9|nr:serine O-acetyltransferase EpsC [Methylocystis sp. JR02]MDJ0450329.1 serine acetyltransferase [Methylocystis sp. JR02]